MLIEIRQDLNEFTGSPLPEKNAKIEYSEHSLLNGFGTRGIGTRGIGTGSSRHPRDWRLTRGIGEFTREISGPAPAGSAPAGLGSEFSAPAGFPTNPAGAPAGFINYGLDPTSAR